MIIIIIIIIFAVIAIFSLFYNCIKHTKQLDNEVKILNDYTARLFNHTVELAKIISEQKKKIDSLEALVKSMSSGDLSGYDF